MSQSLPTEPDRIEVIDVLRGFTLFGIALVHFTEQFYAGMPPEGHNITGPAVIDQVVSGIVGIFIQGKFFMIFSFLFGMSFFLQLNKAKGSTSFFLRFLWRLIILFGIGVIHQIHYRGDILTIYAVLGIGLLVAFWFPDRILFVLALILVLDVPSIFVRVWDAFHQSGNPFDMNQAELLNYYNVVKSGTYLEIINANWKELPGKWFFQVGSGRLYITLGLFLLGLYAGRKNWFGDAARWGKFRRYAAWGLLGCILFMVVIFGGTQLLKIELPQAAQWAIGGAAYDFFNACLATIYVSWIVTLFQKENWRSRLLALYAPGRMGLTTYLMQAAIGVLVFFSIGLGLLGDIGAGLCLILAVAVFYFQIRFAQLWFHYFRFGPVEWLWRSLTYGRIQPMRK
jgi:uncharacterized protein